LGKVTEIEMILSLSLPKVAKASKILAVACCCHRLYRLKYNANVNYPLKMYVEPDDISTEMKSTSFLPNFVLTQNATKISK
jgi:hypothetical protein